MKAQLTVPPRLMAHFIVSIDISSVETQRTSLLDLISSAFANTRLFLL